MFVKTCDVCDADMLAALYKKHRRNQGLELGRFDAFVAAMCHEPRLLRPVRASLFHGDFQQLEGACHVHSLV